MSARRQRRATVHNITAERARRGRLPWAFTIDLAANHFVVRARSDLTPLDAEAMAQAAETWGRALLAAARQLRKRAAGH